MHVLKLKRSKITTAISSYDESLPITMAAQRAALLNWSKTFPKLLISGPYSPPLVDGLRHVKTDPLPRISNLLGTYMLSMPSIEICMLANPEFTFDGDVAPILAHVDAQRMEMAWACHCNIGVGPRAFIMSAPVVAHLMRDMPPDMTFRDDYQTWTHGWMGRLMRHRYFDATQLVGVEPIVEDPNLESDTEKPKATDPLLRLGELVIQKFKTAGGDNNLANQGKKVLKNMKF